MSNAKRAGCQHAEAFCLMRYRSESAEEVVWNSRDGVTPFGITMRDGSQGRHVDWRLDTYDPYWTPKIGDRIFVNLSMDHALQYRRRQVDRWWDSTECPMSGRYESKEQAVELLASEDVKSFGEGTTPYLIEVDAWVLADLLSRRPPRPPYVPNEFA